MAAARIDSFTRYFWMVSSGMLGMMLVLGFNLPLESLAGALLVLVAALFPWYLWCTGKAKGLPIWPLFTMTAIWAYAFPLVFEHPIVVLFPPSYQFVGALTVALALGFGTLAWWPQVRHRQLPPVAARMLPMNSGRWIFWGFHVGALLFNLAVYPGYLAVDVEGFAVVRGVVLGISTLSIFYFGYQHGAGVLNGVERAAYLGVLIASAFVTFTGMLLVNGMSMFLTAFLGYGLGRARIPWLTLVVTMVLTYFANLGKSAQREQYWSEQMWRPVALQEYPLFFVDWVGHSVQALADEFNKSTEEKKEETMSSKRLWERSSLMHLFLYIQYATPAMVPHLNGLTYSHIPELLIPRVFLPSKVKAHFGNNVLAVHYGIVENSEETQTSVGFGFLNEGYANFGIVGTFGVGLLLGGLLGWVTRISASVPIMSFRFLFAVIVLGGAFQVEYTAGVFVSSIFQATIALGGIALLFMQTFRVRHAFMVLMDYLRATAAQMPEEEPKRKQPPLPAPAGRAIPA
ncbi:MAG: hypothetical protein JSR82_00595 [Verrucomicrobia bacterium]|nr:hypothetical protein [Verrucomicrobiota bacterium]